MILQRLLHRNVFMSPLLVAGLAVLSILVWGDAEVAARVLDFDEVAEGTVLDEHYAFMGVHIQANGTGLSQVIAAVPCETAASPPHVLSFQTLGECPQTYDEIGHFEVRFDQPQNLVAITTVHRSFNTSAYLEAYGVDGFIDVVRTQPDAGTVDLPQRLELAPPPDRPRITRILFGVERNGGSAFFDDLELDVVVSSPELHWGTLKASWR